MLESAMIKYGPEKDKAGSSPEPIRIVAFENGKVKHIHHLALHQWSISAPFGKK